MQPNFRSVWPRGLCDMEFCGAFRAQIPQTELPQRKRQIPGATRPAKICKSAASSSKTSTLILFRTVRLRTQCLVRFTQFLMNPMNVSTPGMAFSCVEIRHLHVQRLHTSNSSSMVLMCCGDRKGSCAVDQNGDWYSAAGRITVVPLVISAV